MDNQVPTWSKCNMDKDGDQRGLVTKAEFLFIYFECYNGKSSPVNKCYNGRSSQVGRSNLETNFARIGARMALGQVPRQVSRQTLDHVAACGRPGPVPSGSHGKKNSLYKRRALTSCSPPLPLVILFICNLFFLLIHSLFLLFSFFCQRDLRGISWGMWHHRLVSQELVYQE